MTEAETLHGTIMPDPMALRCGTCHHIMYIDAEETHTDLRDRPLGAPLRKLEIYRARCQCEKGAVVVRSVMKVFDAEPDMEALWSVWEIFHKGGVL